MNELTIKCGPKGTWVIEEGDQVFPIRLHMSTAGWAVVEEGLSLQICIRGQWYIIQSEDVDHGESQSIVVVERCVDVDNRTSLKNQCVQELTIQSEHPAVGFIQKHGMGNHGQMEWIGIYQSFDRQRY